VLQEQVKENKAARAEVEALQEQVKENKAARAEVEALQEQVKAVRRTSRLRKGSNR
jgi:hypothetical protein